MNQNLSAGGAATCSAPRRKLDTLGLAISSGIALALILAAAGTLFVRPFYELSDLAANSLQVEQARHFRELYGPYSRWGFHHPGPVLFYILALGETLFRDWLRCVPAPGNAQLVTMVLLNSSVIGFSLSAFARQLRAPAFLPLALIIGVLHFAAAGSSFLFSPWSPFVATVCFLGLLVAGSSVAAGSARELTLLVFTGGMLVHLHVAMPMFVVPVALLAYAGLVYSRGGSTEGRRFRPWAAFPRDHWIAAGLLALFLLPLVIDLCFGHESNVAAIIDHRRTHPGEHRGFRRSFLYLVQYGAYRTFEPGQIAFGQFTTAAMNRFLLSHALLYVAWAASFLGPVAWLISTRRSRSALSHDSASTEPVRNARHLVRCATGMLALAIMLTLVWARIQDGEMFYHNAFFNYAIYYFSALLLISGVALALQRRGVRGWKLPLWAAVIAVALWRAPAFRFDPGIAAGKTLHDAVRQTLTSDPAPGRAKLLLFDQPAWPLAVGVALDAERLGAKTYVSEEWEVMFGPHRVMTEPATELLGPVPWRIFAAGKAPTGASPLDPEYSLARGAPALDPATAMIGFQAGGNSTNYPTLGLSPADGDHVWSDTSFAVLWFKTLPASDDVELSADVIPYAVPDRLHSQRVRLAFNKHQLGEFDVTGSQTIVCRIPRAMWNETADAHLLATFPDAILAPTPGANNAPLHFAIGFRTIQFRLVPPNPPGI